MHPIFNSGRALKATALLISLVLCGCENVPIKKAFTELGTSSDSEYGAFNTRFIRSINATGLSAEEVVGSLTLDPDKWSATEQARRILPLRPDLPDAMTPRVTTGATFVAVRYLGKQLAKKTANASASTECTASPDLDNSVKIGDLTLIRDGLNGAQYNVARWASLSAKKNVLATVLSELKKPDAAPGTAKSTKLLDAVKSLYPEESADSADAVEKSLASVAKEVAQLDSEWGKFKTSLAEAGIVITNWEREVSASGNANIADASASGGGTRKISGFLILGDPQITTLFIGKDFPAVVDTFKNGTAVSLAKLGSGFAAKRAYITHYQLRARLLVFSESQQTSLHARFEADLQKIAKTLKEVIPSVSLKGLSEVSAKIDGFYAAVTGVAESSVIDASIGRLCTRKLLAEDAKEIEAGSDTIPIVSIRMAIGDYLPGEGK